MRRRNSIAISSPVVEPTTGDVLCAAQDDPIAGTDAAGGRLYVISMPIGHPDDITLRALDVLRSVDAIAAENPVRAGTLLTAYAVQTPVFGYRGRNRMSRVRELAGLIRAGGSLALICDAGTPTLADSGRDVVCAALEAGAQVTTVPGASAALAAASISGFPLQRIAFDGTPPRAPGDRIRYFEGLASETRTIVLFETRTHLPDTLHRLTAVLGNERAVMVARDLTKPGEQVFRGTLEEASIQFARPPVGEYTLVTDCVRHRDTGRSVRIRRSTRV